MNEQTNKVEGSGPGVRYPLVLGVDPGLHGGWALVDSNGTLLDLGPMPTFTIKKRGQQALLLDGQALADTFRRYGFGAKAFVEAVSSRPRQAGQFQFGVNCGVVHGILHAHRVPFQMVAPASWKALYGIKRQEDQSKRDTKNYARELAAKLFPDRAQSFARVKDDGVAEAVLIALYGLSTISQR